MYFKIRCRFFLISAHIILAFLMSPVLCESESSGIPIVKEGEAEAIIVISPEASERTRESAELLSEYIEKSTGARLPVAFEAPSGAPVIYVGYSNYAELFGVEQDGMDIEGFDIAFPDENSIIILGRTDYGTEFGVYEFLERYVGVRWLMAGPYGTDVPTRRNLEIPVEPVRQEPSFKTRFLSGLWEMWGGEPTTFARRNRMRYGSFQPQWTQRPRVVLHHRVRGHHGLAYIFEPSKYAETHPHFYPVIEGKRFIPREGDWLWQPSLSGEGTVEHAISRITEFLDKNPDVTSYDIGIMDTGKFCEIDLAQVRDDYNLSDVYYEWVNRVVEGVLEEHPDIYFGTLSYGRVADPPLQTVLHPRIVPYLCFDRMKWIDEEVKESRQKKNLAWLAKTPGELGWYEYFYGYSHQLPRVYFRLMADYYRWGHAHGVRHIGGEAHAGHAAFGGEGPKYYLALKMMWNVDADEEKILDEWYIRTVGPRAAPYLEEYFNHWEDFVVNRSAWHKMGMRWVSIGALPTYLREVTDRDLAKSRRLLNSVLSRAGTEEQKRRAEAIFRSFEYYEACAILFNAREHPEAGTRREAFEILRMLPAMTALAEKRDSMINEKGGRFYGHPSRPLFSSEGAVALFIRSIGDWAVRDNRIKERVKIIAEAHPYEVVRQSAALLLIEEKEYSKRLIFEDNFEKNEIGPHWRILDGSWEVSDGALHVTRWGNSQIVLNMKLPSSDIRIEYEAVSDYENPNDLSCMLHISSEGRGDWEPYHFRTGYLFGFGLQRNQASMIWRESEHLARSEEHRIEVGKVHAITAEKRGNRLTLQVDDLPPVEGIDFHDEALPEGYFGFYIWAPSRVNRVKVYELIPRD